MAESPDLYSPSGKSGNSLLLTPLACLPLTAIAALIYGYICVYNPLVGYVSILLPLGYGAAIGYCLKGSLKISKCRNPGVAAVLSAGVIAFAIYCAWTCFIFALLDRNASAASPSPTLIRIFTSPAATFNFMCSLASTGWFSIGSGTPSGVVLWLFWIAEAGMIAYVAMIAPLEFTKQTVFCEDCDTWCDAKNDLSRYVPPSGDAEKKARIERGDLTVVADLTPSSSRMANQYLRLDSQRCKQCNETSTFQLSRITITVDKNGKRQEKVEKQTGLVMLTPDSLALLQEALARKAAAAPPEVAAPAPKLPMRKPPLLQKKKISSKGNDGESVDA